MLKSFLLSSLSRVYFYAQPTLGSIKNIHLSYFRNLKFVFSVLTCSSSVFCILALGSGQRLLYRWGSGLVLVYGFVLTAMEVYILNVSPFVTTAGHMWNVIHRPRTCARSLCVFWLHLEAFLKDDISTAIRYAELLNYIIKGFKRYRTLTFAK